MLFRSLMAGSSYFVNGSFANNSNIIILDDFIKYQIPRFSKLRYIDSIIKSNNKVTLISNTTLFNYSSIENYII